VVYLKDCNKIWGSWACCACESAEDMTCASITLPACGNLYVPFLWLRLGMSMRRLWVRRRKFLRSLNFAQDFERRFQGRDFYRRTDENEMFAISLVEGWRGRFCMSVLPIPGVLCRYKDQRSFFIIGCIVPCDAQSGISDFPYAIKL